MAHRAFMPLCDFAKAFFPGEISQRIHPPLSVSARIEKWISI
jgi:hypothetical protein